MTPANARRTAQKAGVPVRDPVIEVGISKVSSEFEDEEFKTSPLEKCVRHPTLYPTSNESSAKKQP